MKNIVITGSTRGIGLCMAREFLLAGCSVTLSGRSKNSGEAVLHSLAEFKDRILYVACNVSVKTELETLWLESAKKWGRIDIWINNAGQNCPNEFVTDTAEEYIDRVIDTNIKGMVFGSRIAAQYMLKQGAGQIWNMEGLGSNNMIIKKTVLYGMSKHALTYFTKGLAKELEGTQVTAGRLSPGMMLTDFITKTPDGEKSSAVQEKAFKSIFNILADKPETVAAFFIPRMLANKKNNAQIMWLTNAKTMFRFLTAGLRKRRLL